MADVCPVGKATKAAPQNSIMALSESWIRAQCKKKKGTKVQVSFSVQNNVHLFFVLKKIAHNSEQI